MMEAMRAPEELTALLRRYQEGDADAAERLVPLVHDELHRLAHGAMARLPPGQTLQTTALLNEAWLRIDRGSAEFASRDHFLAVAAKAMRSILVDRARRRATERRDRGRELRDVDLAVDRLEGCSTDLVALDAALEELAAARPELAQVVVMRFFGGMKHPEIARVLGLPLRRVERQWAAARAWLFARIADDLGAAP